MTEKRLIVDENYNLVDTVTGEWLDDTQVFDLANKLAEENEQLKDALNQRTEQCDEYYKENEQLKQSYKEFEDECQSTFNAMNRKQNDLYRKNFKLKEENEQLKQFKQLVFNLIDKILEKDKEVYEMTYEDYLNGRIEVLEDLKKELSE